MEEAKWYVVHTRTGYENKVKTDLEKTVEHRGMQNLIQEIKIPTEEVIETAKDGGRKRVQRKVYPCYIMVKMIMNSETWYIVRNATGVTGFVGPGTDPVPLSDEEAAAMGVERVAIDHVAVGDHVRIIGGPLNDLVGVVESVDEENQKLRVVIDMIHRKTPVDLEFYQVRPV
jgi:transcription termination/antitermination factor NusG